MLPAYRRAFLIQKSAGGGLSYKVKKGETISLTPIEWKILSAFTRYPQKVFTRDELIASAFDTDFSGYDRVIDTHIKNLRKKIEDDPKNPIYLCIVHGIGYKFGGNI